MKLALLWLCSLSMIIAAPSPAANDGKIKAPHMTSIRVRIGEKVFTARLEENAAGTAFTAMLPLTLEMKDLNDMGNAGSVRIPGISPSAAPVGLARSFEARSAVLFLLPTGNASFKPE